MRKICFLTFAALVAILVSGAPADLRVAAQGNANTIVNPNTYQDLRWRSIGPTRGGRSTAAAGVRTQPNVFYMGATGGGVWSTDSMAAIDAVLMSTWPAAHSELTGCMLATGSATWAAGFVRSIGDSETGGRVPAELAPFPAELAPEGNADTPKAVASAPAGAELI